MNYRAGESPEPDAADANARAPVEADADRPAPLPSEQLLRGRRLVEIAHNGEVYRLQATRLGKLILTK
jgi:hemin uptake protein HemP